MLLPDWQHVSIRNLCWVTIATLPPCKETKQPLGKELNILGLFHSFFSEHDRQIFSLYINFSCLHSLCQHHYPNTYGVFYLPTWDPLQSHQAKGPTLQQRKCESGPMTIEFPWLYHLPHQPGAAGWLEIWKGLLKTCLSDSSEPVLCKGTIL